MNNVEISYHNLQTMIRIKSFWIGEKNKKKFKIYNVLTIRSFLIIFISMIHYQKRTKKKKKTMCISSKCEEFISYILVIIKAYLTG